MIECTSIESSIHFDISKKINISNFQNFKILGCINIGMFLLKHLQNGRDFNNAAFTSGLVTFLAQNTTN
jgi:hypothetical protein